MAAKLIEHNGKKQSVQQWAKETGLTAQTINERLGYGWAIADVLTKPADGTRLVVSSGKQVRTGMMDSVLKVWREVGKEAFEKQLAKEFSEDAIKTILKFQNLFPRELDQTTDTIKPIAAIQINNQIRPEDFQYYKPLGG